APALGTVWSRPTGFRRGRVRARGPARHRSSEAPIQGREEPLRVQVADCPFVPAEYPAGKDQRARSNRNRQRAQVRFGEMTDIEYFVHLEHPAGRVLLGDEETLPGWVKFAGVGRAELLAQIDRGQELTANIYEAGQDSIRLVRYPADRPDRGDLDGEPRVECQPLVAH